MCKGSEKYPVRGIKQEPRRHQMRGSDETLHGHKEDKQRAQPKILHVNYPGQRGLNSKLQSFSVSSSGQRENYSKISIGQDMKSQNLYRL